MSVLTPPAVERRSSRPRPPLGRRLPHLPALVISLLGSIAFTWGANGPVPAALLGLAMLVVPGTFVADLAGPRGPVERMVVTMAVSLTFWMLLAHILLTLQWWEPRFAVFVVLVGSSIAAAVPTPADQAYSTLPTAGSFRGPGAAGRLIDHIGRGQVVGSVVALALWAVSLPFISTDDLGDWGLVAELPPTYFAAFGVAIVVAVAAALAPSTSPRRLAVSIAPLLTIIYGTLPILVGTIRYPWAYKHVGVIRLLDETGRFHPEVDIYNNFSGFFGLGALVRGATGVDPTSYAAWTQLVAEGLILVAVWLLVRRATDSERVAHLSAVLYLLTNWVGQNYFAAQTLATFLSLAVLGLAASWFIGGPTRPFRLMRESITRVAPTTPAADVAALPARRVVVLLAFLGLVMTHPLTPAATLGALTLAWIVGWLRDRVLLVGMYAIAVGWALRSFRYFAAQSFDLGFGGSPSSNAEGNLDYSDAPSAVVAVGDLTRLFSASVWLCAFIGALLCAWAMRRTGVLLVAACIPFGIPLVQSYGGEAIYRVYLYSLPLVVAFVAWGIVTRTPMVRRERLPQPTILASVICLLLGAGFLVAHFGRERINNVDRSEVAMGDYIAETVADPAVMAQFDGTYPAASSARYPSFQVNDTYVPYITDLVEADGRLPSYDDLAEAADDLWALDAGTPYVVVSPGMIDSVEQVASVPIGSTLEAVDLLVSSERYRVVHRIDDTWLIEVLP